MIDSVINKEFERIMLRISDRYFARDGSKMNCIEWAHKFNDPNYHIVKQTKLRHARKWVSTVWIGLSHQFGDGPPLIFETMVFQWGRYIDIDCERTSTEHDARLAHELLCQYWRKNRRQRRKFGLRRPVLD